MVVKQVITIKVCQTLDKNAYYVIIAIIGKKKFMKKACSRVSDYRSNTRVEHKAES